MRIVSRGDKMSTVYFATIPYETPMHQLSKKFKGLYFAKLYQISVLSAPSPNDKYVVFPNMAKICAWT